MILVEPGHVLKLFGVGASTTTSANAVPAIELASRVLEALVDTSLESQTQIDYFNNAGPPFKSKLKIPVRLRLTNSYVDPSTVVFRYATDSLPLRTSTSGTILSYSDVTGGYLLDAVKGVLTLLSTSLPLGNQVFSITYASGFDLDVTSDIGLLGDLPKWMPEAAAALAVYILKTFPSNHAHKSNIGRGQLPNEMEQDVYAMGNILLSKYRRPRVNLQGPVFTQVVDG